MGLSTFLFIKTVLRRNLEHPAILAGLAAWSNWPPQPPSLWECGNPCSVRVSKLRGRSRNAAMRVRCFALGASFPQRTSDYQAFWRDRDDSAAVRWEHVHWDS